MIRHVITMLTWVCLIPVSYAQTEFNKSFADGMLRMDFYHGVDKDRHLIIPDALYREPHYAGRTDRLMGDLTLGSCRFIVTDSADGKVLFADAYSSMFDEWQHTQEAMSGGRKVYHESIRFPFPRNTVLVRLEVREYQGNFSPIYERYINPLETNIIRISPASPFDSGDLLIVGPVTDKIDVVFLAEGYTSGETSKFKKDARRLLDLLLAAEPFRSYAARFNFRYVASVSQESGTDEPDKGVFRNTILNSSFNTFNVARYVTSADNRTMRNLAAPVPYEHIVVVTNSYRYGGAGFYNLYSLFCSDMPYLADVFVHEFGHQFGGLADEYDGDFTDTYYNLSIEPWEANITTTTDKARVKWHDHIKATTPVPTPNDTMYRDVVGVFEGAGYSNKGMFRPQLYCIMRSFEVRSFCAVCRDWLVRTIEQQSR